MAWRHYLNQCWIIVNWTLANIFQWKFNQNTAIFIEENAHENVFCEMASILSRPQWVNPKDIHFMPQALQFWSSWMTDIDHSLKWLIKIVRKGLLPHQNCEGQKGLDPIPRGSAPLSFFKMTDQDSEEGPVATSELWGRTEGSGPPTPGFSPAIIL